MKELKSFSPLRTFSHIYVEKEILSHPITEKILNRFPKSIIIEIDSYKEVFSRSNQNYKVQELSKKLILAKKRKEFIYPGPPLCPNFGQYYFYYTTLILNCIFSCDYCFLKGMYPSAHIVVFVNIEDYFKEIDEILKDHPLYLSISYNTDLLALENIVPFFSMFLNYAENKKDLIIEVRTKSCNLKIWEELKPRDNVILSWTLLPDEIIKKYEKTPSLDLRIKAIKKAIDHHWIVRLNFDPLIYVEDYKEVYKRFVEKVFQEIDPSKIYDLSIGVFRIPKDYFKRMKKIFINEVTLFPYEEGDNAYTYPHELKKELINFLIENVSLYIPKEKIFTI